MITPIFHKLSATEPESAEIDAEIERLKARIGELEAKKAELSSEQPENDGVEG